LPRIDPTSTNIDLDEILASVHVTHGGALRRILVAAA